MGARSVPVFNLIKHKGTQDLFESIRMSTKAKLQVFQEYPAMYYFLKSIVIEPQELLDELKPRNQECVQQSSRLQP